MCHTSEFPPDSCKILLKAKLLKICQYLTSRMTGTIER